jgi:hypothetical protein
MMGSIPVWQSSGNNLRIAIPTPCRFPLQATATMLVGADKDPVHLPDGGQSNTIGARSASRITVTIIEEPLTIDRLWWWYLLVVVFAGGGICWWWYLLVVVLLVVVLLVLVLLVVVLLVVVLLVVVIALRCA